MSQTPDGQYESSEGTTPGSQTSTFLPFDVDPEAEWATSLDTKKQQERTATRTQSTSQPIRHAAHPKDPASFDETTASHPLRIASKHDPKLLSDLVDTKENIPTDPRLVGAFLGDKLIRGIQEGKFKHFFFAIMLGLTYDLLGIIGLFIDGGLVTNIIFGIFSFGVSATLWYILMTQENFFKRFIRKYFLKRVLIAFGVEAFLGFLPMYTLMVLWISRSLWKKTQKMRRTLQDLKKSGLVDKKIKAT